MKGKCKSRDRISFLPQDTIEKILTHMPIRDALRTSILSKKWRYSWRSMPKLVFNSKSMAVISKNYELDKYKFLNAVFHVLMLRSAPILEFSLIVDTCTFWKIEPIISYLSMSNNVKEFIIKNEGFESCLLPRSLFTLEGLEHLHLSYCEFKSPLMNKEFSKLKSLYFYLVTIPHEMVFKFLTKCPLLEKFTWMNDCDNIDLTECELVELLKCLPSVQVLELGLCIKDLGAGNMPHKLPISLPNLRILVLHVCSHELSIVIRVISTSPNLEKIKIKCSDHDECFDHDDTFENLPDTQNYSGLRLDHLKELEVTSYSKDALEIEFVKLIMTKSPVLKKARISLLKCEFVQTLKCLPSIEHLEISMHLDAGGMPHKLPIPLPHLRILVLNVCSLDLLFVVWVISNSPKLEKIKLMMCGDHVGRCTKQTFENLPNIQDYTDLNLDHLQEMEIVSFHNHALEMEFVKLIMAKSPVLKKARIELHTSVSVKKENKMLRDLVHMPLPRASPEVSFSIERPKDR